MISLQPTRFRLVRAVRGWRCSRPASVIFLQWLRCSLLRPLIIAGRGEDSIWYRDDASKLSPQIVLKSTSSACSILKCLKCPRCLRFPSSPRRSGALAVQCSSAIRLKVFPQSGGGWPLAFTLSQAPARPRAQPRQTMRAVRREVVSSFGARCPTSRSCGRAAQPTGAEAGWVEVGAFADSNISRSVIDKSRALGARRRAEGFVGMWCSLWG